MPKSFLGPKGTQYVSGLKAELRVGNSGCCHTAGVVARRQQDASRGLALANDMAGRWRRQDAVLADQQLPDTVGSSDLGDQLDHLGVPEAAVAANDQERV